MKSTNSRTNPQPAAPAGKTTSRELPYYLDVHKHGSQITATGVVPSQPTCERLKLVLRGLGVEAVTFNVQVEPLLEADPRPIPEDALKEMLQLTTVDCEIAAQFIIDSFTDDLTKDCRDLLVQHMSNCPKCYRKHQVAADVFDILLADQEDPVQKPPA
jgi:hypothetical protein